MTTKSDKATADLAVKQSEERVDKAAYINAQLAKRLAPADFGLASAPDARQDYTVKGDPKSVKSDG